MARYLDLPLKWKCGRAGVAPEHGFDAYCAQRAIRFLETNQSRQFACFLAATGSALIRIWSRGRSIRWSIRRIWRCLPYRPGEFENKPRRQRQSFETQGASKMTDDQIRRILAVYYGMAAFSDVSVGLVLSRLREFHLDDNTVVILVSGSRRHDGAASLHEQGFQAFYEPKRCAFR